MEIRKILFAGLLVACFSGAFADKPSVEEILQSGALPTGSATLAAIGDKNGASVTQSDLQNADFWNSNTGINWDPSSSGAIGNPWLKTGTAIPIHRTGQEGYNSFYDTIVTVASTTDYKNITGLYGYKITINLVSDLNFEGESLPPLFNIVAFIGNNHTIYNFSIKGDCSNTGLLATVTDSVCDLTLKINSFENISNTSNAGALVGHLLSTAKMWNCHVRSYSTSRATVSGEDYVGGLVGYSEGTIDSCSVSGVNIIASNDGAGGLVGHSIKNITNCSVDSASIKAGRYFAGGLAGDIRGTNTIITNNKVDSVSVYSGNTHAGGLLGNDDVTSGTISNCSVNNAIVTAQNFHAGGLLGSNRATVSKCLVSDATVSTLGITTSGYVGGLIGESFGASNISECTVNNATIKGYEKMGGLIGVNTKGDTVSGNTVKVTTITGFHKIGGLIGDNGNNKIVFENTVNGATITGTGTVGIVGGLIGHNSATNTVSKNTVGGVIINGYEKIGGLIGANVVNTIVSENTVNGATITGTGDAGIVGGLIGLNSATNNVFNNIVKEANISGTQKIGGLIGETSSPNTAVFQCCVDNVSVKAEKTFVGGLAGINAGSIHDCSVSRATLISTYSAEDVEVKIGGIVADNGTGATVDRCLITGSTIRSDLTKPEKGSIGGIAGWNSGNVLSSVAMIKYFELRGLYIKGGDNLGRIAAVKGNLANNYGWVETTIRYYEKRFGVNWENDVFYRGTGNIDKSLKNGDNLFTGDVYSSVSPQSKGTSFWAGLNFNEGNGWHNVDNQLFPKLTMVKDSNLGDLGTVRGFEREAWQIDIYRGSGKYTDGNMNDKGGVKIFTPHFFSENNYGYYARLEKVDCYLYTDIYLMEDNGTGNSVFWSADLNLATSGNISASAIRYEGTDYSTFYGNGYSIMNFEMNARAIELGQGYWGFFRTDNAPLGIKRLQIENPYCSMNRGSEHNGYARYGFLITETSNSNSAIELEDIYVKNPRLDITSFYPFSNLAFSFGNNGVIASMVGYAYNLKGRRLAVYMDPNTDKSKLSGYLVHIGCLFGLIQNNIELNQVAVSVGYSPTQLTSKVVTFGTYSAPTQTSSGEDNRLSQSLVMGYICGLGINSNEAVWTTTNKTFSGLSIHDGFIGRISEMNWPDYFPHGTHSAPLPWILQLGQNCDTEPSGGLYRDCGANYPRQGSFYQTLVNSGIKDNNDGKWYIPENASPDAVHLNREEYTGNYINY